MLFFAIVSFYFQTISLEYDTSLTFKLKEISYSSKTNFEFYSGVDVAIKNNEFIFVLDKGNKSLMKLNSNYEVVSEYNKTGSGPGEFDMVTNLILTKNRIVVNGLKKWLFDFDLDYKGEIFYPINIGLLESDEKIKIIIATEPGQFDYLTYDLDGKKIGNSSAHFSGYIQRKSQKSNIKISHVYPIEYQNSMFFYFSNDYAFSIRNKLNSNSYSRVYNREKYENYDDLEFYYDSGNYNPKTDKAKAVQSYINKFGEFRSDISSFIGAYSNYLFLRTSSNNHKLLKFDLIDLDKNKYKEFILKFEDVIYSAKLFDKSLIITFKNNETGPYFKVYNVTFR